jgi:isopentenyldiphosphate isomerase
VKTAQKTKKMIDNEYIKTKEKVRRELANYLGLEPDDIEDDSVLAEDLHMKATDLTDFSEILTTLELDTSKLDLTEIETFLDLVDSVTAHA